MKKFLFSVILVVSLVSTINAIEVGGHLTEDTIWFPDNNPYLVTSAVYVDEDVTLTILPGTIVKFNDAFLQHQNNDEFWFNSGIEPLAKFIRCEGRIIAEGTEQDSIIFTRVNNEPQHHWGTIYITQNAELSIFKHCLIEYSAFIGFSIGEQIVGGLSIYNGLAKIENCTFIDNKNGVRITKHALNIIIKDCNFLLLGSLVPNTNFLLLRLHAWNYYDTEHLLIANNFFNSCMLSSSLPVYFVFNNGDYFQEDYSAIYLSCEDDINYVYGNEVNNYMFGISGAISTTSTYIKNNEFNNDGEGVNINDGYVEISDNYFNGCDIDTGFYSSGKVFNNYVISGDIGASSYLEVFNNIVTSGNLGLVMTYRSDTSYNNLSIQNQYAFDGNYSSNFDNCIFILNEDISCNGVSGNPIFRNCITDFPLDPPLIDGGGNIIVDSLQAQSIFVDIQNGDFHLAQGSIAIDAGFDTLGYYYPFDMDYNHRVWDGDGNGSAIIDIGPYEYGAPAFGGIQGITYDPTTGDFVDYVLLKINNQPGEFTFSDSIGSYQIKLPAGVYDVYAERVFYDDAVEYQIEVFDGQFTQLDIAMNETVDVQNYEIISIKNDFNLNNFPNPFNPETTIEFSIQNNSDVELTIFNIKGQRIATLINEKMQKGKHSIIWSGCDQHGNQVSSGIYFYKLKVGNQESVKRMLLLK